MSFIDFPVFEVPNLEPPIIFDKNPKMKSLLVVVNSIDYQGKYINNLKELITAIQIKEEEVLIVQLDEAKKLQLSEYNKVYHFKYCLNFGFQDSYLGLNIEDLSYQIFNFENMVYLKVDSLSFLMESQSLKKKLWLNLKQMFGV